MQVQFLPVPKCNLSENVTRLHSLRVQINGPSMCLTHSEKERANSSRTGHEKATCPVARREERERKFTPISPEHNTSHLNSLSCLFDKGPGVDTGSIVEWRARLMSLPCFLCFSFFLVCVSSLSLSRAEARLKLPENSQRASIHADPLHGWSV